MENDFPIMKECGIINQGMDVESAAAAIREHVRKWSSGKL
jgi:hypothetical protein